MTIRELYARVGGNYDQAVRVLQMDKLIDKYIRKLPNNRFDEALAAAGQTMDATALFETAHAMKGVCANLGLDALAQAAGEITEEFRPGAERKLTDEDVREKLNALDESYRRVTDEIRQYAGEA